MSVKAKPLRSSKMSRNLSRHSGVSCDACGKSSFSGRRYKCLTCYDFDLCAECYESGDAGSSRHSPSHPMQCILTRVESELYFGGEVQMMDAPQSFTCPLCSQIGFSEAELRNHMSNKHVELTVSQEVICPVCAAYPNGDPNNMMGNLPIHITMEHRALEDSVVAQSRVRRLIGRRRAGLDRYIGVLSREMGQGSQDNIDPIAELLTQLSGPSGGGSSAGGGSERRLIADYPPHIQMLLEQQDRQAYDRASPLRRPVYRKLVSGSGGMAPPMPYESYPLPVNLLSGHLLDTPQTDKAGGSGGALDAVCSRVQLLTDVPIVKKEAEKNMHGSGEKESPFLLANYSLPELSGKELDELEEKRKHRSRFVQELLLSTLAYSDSGSGSSDDGGDEHEQT